METHILYWKLCLVQVVVPTWNCINHDGFLNRSYDEASPIVYDQFNIFARLQNGFLLSSPPPLSFSLYVPDRKEDFSGWRGVFDGNGKREREREWPKPRSSCRRTDAKWTGNSCPFKLCAPWSVMKIYGIKGNLFPDRFVVDQWRRQVTYCVSATADVLLFVRGDVGEIGYYVRGRRPLVARVNIVSRAQAYE